MVHVDAYTQGRSQQTLGILQAVTVALCLIFAVFAPYNLLMLESPANYIAAAHDIATSLTLLGVALALRMPHFPRWGLHPIATAATWLIASNMLLMQVLTAQSIQLVYQALLIVGVGLVFTSVTWGAMAVAGLLVASTAAWILTWPLDATLIHGCFGALSVSFLSMGLCAGRVWFVDRITTMTLREREHKNALREALDTARSSKRELDATVARRTSELRWANAALQRQVAESQRASTAAVSLTAQLQHAQRVDAVGQLTGRVAHDFNNLITAVIGNVEMALLDVPPGSPTAEALIDAKTSAVRAAQLTQQLLSFARKDDNEIEIYSVTEALTAMRSVMGRLLGEDIRLTVRTPDEDLRVPMAPVQLDQILLNLAVNARDAMPLGGDLRVRAKRDGDNVRISVRDTGSGMDETTKNHIFEPYFTTKPKGKGTGLGLATVHGIVASNGGHIEVKSELGHGTEFIILLPLADTLIPSRRSSLPPVRLPRGRGERVLVVEDEGAVRRIAVRILKRLGYQTLSAASGPEALRLLTKQPGQIDLLWTDVLMPGMDGKELADRLLLAYPGTRVLFASGYSGDKLAPRGILPTETNFLHKPYDASDVARAVRRAIDA